MANNRLWLVDGETGERVLLAKSLGGGWYLHHDAATLDTWLEARMDPAAWGNSDAPTTLRLVAENSEPDPPHAAERADRG